MNTLLIRFTEDSEFISFCRCNANAVPQPPVNARLEDLLAEGVDAQRIVLLVPTTDVLLTRITLPIRQTQKLVQAIPFALEDQLAEDIDLLHFAIGRRADDGSVPVAVVAREKMDAWLAPLLTRGLRPSAIYPDALCLPLPEDEAGQWSALVESDRISVRTGTASGFGCDGELLNLMLEKTSPPPDLVVKTYPLAASPELPALPARVEATAPAEDALEHLCAGALASPPFDLLQGMYAPPDAAGNMWRTWRWTLALAAALLVVTVGLRALNAFQLQAQASELQARTQQRFHQLFPDIHRIVNMRAQGEQALQTLKLGSHGDEGLLFLLASSAQALAQVKDLTVTRMTYRQNRLELSLRGSNLQALETLRARFTEQSAIALQVLSANADSGGVQIHISVTRREAGPA